MQALRIWAPAATRVEVVVGDERRACTSAADGWWRCETLRSGDEYLISIDGREGRPDPGSRWQPHGVHGPSRWFEPTEGRTPLPAGFRHVPLRDAVIYEMHIGTFTDGGTFVSAAEELAHLVTLGVTHVEIMPVAQWSGTHGWGYDGVDLFAPHVGYGGPAGLHYFMRTCHEHGLGVIIDVVHNHFGPDGSYHDQFAPYRTSAHQTPWGDAINLDGADAPHVRRFLIDSAIQWLRDYGADGLRLDALHALRDTSDRHFVAELVDEVRALEVELGRPFLLIGEWDDHDPRAVAPRDAGGWGLDAHWNDDFHHAIHALLTGERGSYYMDFADPRALEKVLRDGYVLEGGPQRGHHVIASGRNLAALAQLRDEATGRLDTVALDVTQPASIAAAVIEVARLANNAPLDVLVNNAGFGILGPTAEITDDEMRRQFETNVFGLMNVTRAFLPQMQARRAGRIVNISSMGGRVTMPYFGVYNATKYALEALSNALRYELHAFGIDVTLVEPGVIRTNFETAAVSNLERFASTAYGPAVAKYEEMSRQADRFAAEPMVIARAIAHASEVRRPAARYVAPRFNAIAIAASALLPTRVWDWAMRKLGHLDAKTLFGSAPRKSSHLKVAA